MTDLLPGFPESKAADDASRRTYCRGDVLLTLAYRRGKVLIAIALLPLRGATVFLRELRHRVVARGETPMPRANRMDEPGAWHHVMNRGIARRTVFEGRADIRFFLSRLAIACRRRTLEVHAFAVLATHFHLLVRSVTGELSSTMMWIEHEYVRWFNRRRRRDGPLFRGRFLSRRVASSSYWQTLLRYIDDNPVAARVAERATEYPWCSAWHYCRGSGTPWLARSEVEAIVASAAGRNRFVPSDYLAFAASEQSTDARWIVERRLAAPRPAREDSLVDLIQAAPAAVVDWMQRKARLADGTRVEDVLASPDSIDAALRWRSGRNALVSETLDDDTTLICRAGLLRDIAGLLHHEISARLRRPRPTCARWIEEHRRRLQRDSSYAERAATIARHAMRRSSGTVDPATEVCG